MAKHKYTEKIAAQVCDRIATSHDSLKIICEELNIHPSTVFQWIAKKPDFADKYARAREAQADFLADELLEIADDSTHDTIITEDGAMLENKEWVNRSKLRVDARKWIASKLKPKKYGEKLDLEHSGNLAIVWNEEKTYEEMPSPEHQSAPPNSAKPIR